MELYTEVENAKVRLPAHSPLHPRIVTATSENLVVVVVAQFTIKENKFKHFSKYKSEKPHQPSPELTDCVQSFLTCLNFPDPCKWSVRLRRLTCGKVHWIFYLGDERVRCLNSPSMFVKCVMSMNDKGRYLMDDELEEIRRPKKTKKTIKRMRADTYERGAALRLPALPASVRVHIPVSPLRRP
jgi:hypothetical protein